jgi:hypothetical protein
MINTWKSSGCLCTTRFSVIIFYIPATQSIYMFYMVLRTNRDYLAIQHEFLGVYNGDAVCLLRGTD